MYYTHICAYICVCIYIYKAFIFSNTFTLAQNPNNMSSSPAAIFSLSKCLSSRCVNKEDENDFPVLCFVYFVCFFLKRMLLNMLILNCKMCIEDSDDPSLFGIFPRWTSWPLTCCCSCCGQHLVCLQMWLFMLVFCLKRARKRKEKKETNHLYPPSSFYQASVATLMNRQRTMAKLKCKPLQRMLLTPYLRLWHLKTPEKHCLGISLYVIQVYSFSLQLNNVWR